MNKRIKYGGRQKGTENKITRDLKEVFKNIIDANLETIEKDLQQLAPKERIDVILKMSEYVLPKLQRITDSQIENEPVNIIIERRGVNGELEKIPMFTKGGIELEDQYV